MKEITKDKILVAIFGAMTILAIFILTVMYFLPYEFFILEIESGNQKKIIFMSAFSGGGLVFLAMLTIDGIGEIRRKLREQRFYGPGLLQE